jgi:hypothetical protein
MQCGTVTDVAVVFNDNSNILKTVYDDTILDINALT